MLSRFAPAFLTIFFVSGPLYAQESAAESAPPVESSGPDSGSKPLETIADSLPQAEPQAADELAPNNEINEESWLGLPGEWNSKGETAVESRVFSNDHTSATVDQALALFARLELKHSHSSFEEKVRFFARADSQDQGRTLFIPEEGYVQWKSDWLRIRIGADIINWTATEAFHPADVINARNLDSDMENFEKVGEPMAQIQLRPSEGTTLAFLAMPYFSRLRFTSARSRLNIGPAGVNASAFVRRVDADGKISNENWGAQGAFYVRQALGSADISLHALQQMDRSQPFFTFDPVVFTPALIFETVRQVGGTYQQVFGGLIVKLEAAYRQFIKLQSGQLLLPEPNRDHAAVALGLEYGFAHEQGSESTFLLEGQMLAGPSKAIRDQLSFFQRDVLVGYRFAANDENDHQFMLGAIADVEDFDELLLNASLSRRLGEEWTLRGGLRIFAIKSGAGPYGIYQLRDADHIRLTLTRHF